MIALGNLIQFQDMNGSLLAAGYVFVYHLGRSELATIYNDHNGAHVADNPVRLDDMGMCDVYLNECYNYTVVVMDAYGQEMFSRDIYPDKAGGGDGRYEGVDPIVVNNDVNVISANTTRFGVQEPLYFVRDDESATIIGFSGTLPVPEGTMSESALGYQDGKITGYNGSAFSAGNSYEAGSYIDIDGNTISVTGLSPVPADTASTGLVASVSADITAMIPDTSDMATRTWVNEQGFLTDVSDKLDASAFSAVSGDFLTAIPPEYVTENTLQSGLSSKLDSSSFSAVSSTFLTAVPAGYATEDWVTGQGYLTAHQSLDGLMSASLLEISDNKITGYNGTAFASQGGTASDYELVEGNGIQITDDPTAQTTTISVSGDYATNTQLQNVSADITAMIPTADYLDKASADTLYYPKEGNPSGFITGVDLTPYQLTADMTAYQSAGDYLTTADSANFLTGIPDTYLQNTDLGINGNKVTAISGVEVGGGSNVTTDVARFTVAPNTAGVPVNISYYTSTPVQELATTITPQDFVMSNNRLILSSDANGINYSAGQVINIEVTPNSLYELYLCYVNGNSTAAATTGDQGRIAVDYHGLSGNYSAVITAAPGTYTALALTTDYYNASTQTASINKVELYEPNSALGFNVKIDNPAEFAKYSDPKPAFTGTYKFIVGEGNVVNGNNSMAVGYYNTAEYNAFALGQYNTAESYGITMGSYNSANGYYTVAIGGDNNADSTAVALGEYNSASNKSFAQGNYNSASYDSFVQGENNTARDYSMAQGYRNSAQNYSFAQGRGHTAVNNSIAQGGYNSARNYSIAQGEYNTAYNYSQAFGGYTKATNSGMAIGSYNAKEDGAFVVGNGTWQQRHDAFWIDHNGNVSAAGKISANGVELGTMPGTYLQNTDLEISDNKITGISGVPLAAGGEVPAGVMVESGLEYDNTEISGYSGSAFKDVALTDVVTANSGAWGGSALPISAGPGIKFDMVDSTLVASTDETVLWSSDATAFTSAFNTNEPITNFKEVKAYGMIFSDNDYMSEVHIYDVNALTATNSLNLGFTYLIDNGWRCWGASKYHITANTAFAIFSAGRNFCGPTATANYGTNGNIEAQNGWIYKLVGVTRTGGN